LASAEEEKKKSRLGSLFCFSVIQWCHCPTRLARCLWTSQRNRDNNRRLHSW